MKILPVGYKRIVVRNRPYFYYYGTYYTQVDNSADEYEVVDAPIGAEVDALPEGYEVVIVEGQEYYKLDDTYYEARINDKDEEYYTVIDSPENL